MCSRSMSATVAPSSRARRDRKSTRLNSSHANISYAVFCLKKKSNCTMKQAKQGAAKTCKAKARPLKRTNARDAADHRCRKPTRASDEHVAEHQEDHVDKRE